MKIKELMIRKNNAEKLDVSWEISDGDQSSYELFLIREGSIVERVKTPSAAMRCSLRTIVEPMKQYALLLTVNDPDNLRFLSCEFHGVGSFLLAG